MATNESGTSGERRKSRGLRGVSDGTRTRDHLDHNLSDGGHVPWNCLCHRRNRHPEYAGFAQIHATIDATRTEGELDQGALVGARRARDDEEVGESRLAHHEGATP